MLPTARNSPAATRNGHAARAGTQGSAASARVDGTMAITCADDLVWRHDDFSHQETGDGEQTDSQ